MSVTILVLTALAAPSANQPAGSVAGIITDTTGRGVPGARILLTAEDGRVREAVTNPIGRYEIEGAPAARYRIEARMNGFDAKVSALTVVAGQVADWSGALLIGPAFGEASIERRVRAEAGWDAADCGRHGATATAADLEASLACARESSELRRPFSVIVQVRAGGALGGHGLLAGPDGVIHRFEYRRGGLEFHLQPAPSIYLSFSKSHTHTPRS